MTKEFNNIDEIKKYYDKERNTYYFREDGRFINVIFEFDLVVNAHISAKNITARNITAWDITARDIDAGDIKGGNIKARNIFYYAVCFAYDSITCNMIFGRRNNHKHFVLDGKIIINGEEAWKWQ